MHETLLLCLGLILTVSFLVMFAHRIRIAYPIILVAAGLVLGFIPHIPQVHIDPDLVFLVILPPVLFDAAQNISWKALWKWRRIITVMAFGFVLVTATAVAFVSYLLIPGFTLAEGFLLGAIVSPPDAAAATAVLRYIRLPKAMTSILEGESLLNDAASLTVFRFALAVIVGGGFVVWHQVALGFVFIPLSGIGIGLAIGLVFYAICRWLPTTANLDIALSLVLPYLLYLTAERFHSSGVLSVVTGGIFVSYQNHFIVSYSSRLKSRAIWSSIVFILNAVLFLLIGLQLPDIINGLKDITLAGATGIALIITGVIIVTRMLAGLFSSVFTRFISRYITVAQNNPGFRNPLVISWIGMRGVVSLASALSIPLILSGDQPFPHRDLILFITYTVIIVTLVFQGLTIPWVIRIVKPEGASQEKTDDQQLAEIERQLFSAALQRLEEKYAVELQSNTLLKNKADMWKLKIRSLDGPNPEQEERGERSPGFKRFRTMMNDLLELERKELHRFRKINAYDDDIIAIVEKRLDLEEERLNEDME